MSTLIAMALAAEIGANAPDELKPCPDDRPKKIENAKPRPKPKVGLVQKHVLKTKKLPPAADCDEPLPASPFAALFPEVPIAYVSTPEAPSFEVATLPDAPAPEDKTPPVSVFEATPYAATFASFGGGGTFGGYSAIGGPRCVPCDPIQGFAQPVPEPSTWAFLGLGLLSLAGLGRKR